MALAHPGAFFTTAVVRPFSDFADEGDDDVMVGLRERGDMDGRNVGLRHVSAWSQYLLKQDKFDLFISA